MNNQNVIPINIRTMSQFLTHTHIKIMFPSEEQKEKVNTILFYELVYK